MISAETTVKRLQAELDGHKWQVEKLRAWCLTQINGEQRDDTGTAENGPGQAESMLLVQIVTMIDNGILKGWK